VGHKYVAFDIARVILIDEQSVAIWANAVESILTRGQSFCRGSFADAYQTMNTQPRPWG